MSDPRAPHDAPRDLAAEYAIGVLDGEELAQARRLAEADASFRAEVARWTARLTPLLDDFEPVTAPASVWRIVERRTGASDKKTTNLVHLERRLRAWQGVAGAMTALAASLAIYVAIPQSPPALPTQGRQAAASPMVAMLSGDAKDMTVVASWDPAAQRLVLAVAGDMPADPRHAHELWVIPAGGKPRSLGTMAASRKTHMELADALAELMRQGATIAITVEPQGGSPTGDPTGPVIAAGALERA